jgi:hypothetical protein
MNRTHGPIPVFGSPTDTKASAVMGPTPGCVISRRTSGRLLASCSAAAVGIQDDGVDHAEDGRGSRDAESKRQERGEGEAGIIFQLAHRVTQVLKQGFHDGLRSAL